MGYVIPFPKAELKPAKATVAAGRPTTVFVQVKRAMLIMHYGGGETVTYPGAEQVSKKR